MGEEQRAANYYRVPIVVVVVVQQVSKLHAVTHQNRTHKPLGGDPSSAPRANLKQGTQNLTGCYARMHARTNACVIDGDM